MDLTEICSFAKATCRKVANLQSNVKNEALLAMGEAIYQNKDYILKMNKLDIENAVKVDASEALIDSITLNDEKIENMASKLVNIAKLADPVGEVIRMYKMPSGLNVGQQREPLGLIALIYENNPKFIVDSIGLCLKSGNTVILKGGTNDINTNRTIYKLLTNAAIDAGVPIGTINFIDIDDNISVNELISMNKYIDVVIPKGSKKLVEDVAENTRIPIIKIGQGNCHIYVDKTADLDMAEKIIINAKTSKPQRSNSVEKLLVHQEIAKKFLPKMLNKLEVMGVEVRGCERVQSIYAYVKPAVEEDWETEYADYKIAVKIVDDIDQAIDHINRYSSGHSESIVTNNYMDSRKFLNEVDSSVVYVNASTSFTDGDEFGLGAEMGTSTQKLHVRGPIGLRELTSLKYVVFGEGHIR